MKVLALAKCLSRYVMQLPAAPTNGPKSMHDADPFSVQTFAFLDQFFQFLRLFNLLGLELGLDTLSM